MMIIIVLLEGYAQHLLSFQITYSDFLQIDEEILQEVVRMGFDRNRLIESIRNRLQNEVSIYLLLKFYPIFYLNVFECNTRHHYDCSCI